MRVIPRNFKATQGGALRRGSWESVSYERYVALRDSQTVSSEALQRFIGKLNPGVNVRLVWDLTLDRKLCFRVLYRMNGDRS